MKKLIAVLLATALLIASTVTVFAGDPPDPKIVVPGPIVIMGDPPDPK